MTNKDQYVVMNVACNLDEIAERLKSVLGDTEIVQELFANIRLLHSTRTVTRGLNTVVSQIVAEEEPSVEASDLSNEDPSSPYWTADNKTPAKTSNSIDYERKQKQRRKDKKSKSV